jgi:hypothetical protein
LLCVDSGLAEDRRYIQPSYVHAAECITPVDKIETGAKEEEL